MSVPIRESLRERGLWTVLAKPPFMWKMAENKILTEEASWIVTEYIQSCLHQLRLNWLKAHEQRELDLKHSHLMHYVCFFFFFFFRFCDLGLKNGGNIWKIITQHRLHVVCDIDCIPNYILENSTCLNQRLKHLVLLTGLTQLESISLWPLIFS